LPIPGGELYKSEFEEGGNMAYFRKEPLVAVLKMVAGFAGKFPVSREGSPSEEVVLVRLIFNGAKLIVEAVNPTMGIGMRQEIATPDQSDDHVYIVPLKTLLDVVTAGGNGIEFTHEKKGLGVQNDGGKFLVKNVGELDAIPLIEGAAAAAEETDFTGVMLAEAINLVADAAERNNDSRPYLAGVRVAPDKKGGVTFVATDGNRMGVYTKKTDTPKAFETAFTIPIEAVRPITTTLSQQQENVWLVVVSNKVEFHWQDGYVFTLRQADNFPQWEQLIPRSCGTKITFNGSLAAALKTARIVAREDPAMPLVTLTVGKDKVTVTSEVADVGKTTTEVSPTSIEGKDTEVSFNINLIPVSQLSSGAVVELNAAQNVNPTAPSLWKSPAIEGWQYLLMPIRRF